MGRSGQGNGRTDLRPEKRSGELLAAPTDGPTEGRSAHSDITNRLASNLFPSHPLSHCLRVHLVSDSLKHQETRQSAIDPRALQLARLPLP